MLTKHVITVSKYKHNSVFTQYSIADINKVPEDVELIFVVGKENETNHSKACRIAAILNEK